MCSCLTLNEGEAREQAESDDADRPHDRYRNRDAVEVSLGDARGTEAGGHAASEHVGEPSATPLVQKDEECEEQAREHENTQQDHLDNYHSGFPLQGRRARFPAIIAVPPVTLFSNDVVTELRYPTELNRI